MVSRLAPGQVLVPAWETGTFFLQKLQRTGGIQWTGLQQITYKSSMW